MKNDVAVVLCPPWAAEYPPIGLAYLTGYLKARGKSAVPIDVNIDFYRDALPEDRPLYAFGSSNLIDLDFYESYRKRYAHLFSRAVDRIVEADARVVGFSICSYNKLIALEIAGEVKKRRPETQIVLGGFGISVGVPDSNMKYGVRIDGGLSRSGVGIDDRDYPYFEDVDYLGIGEGEVLLDSLVEAIVTGDRDPATVPGVVASPFPNPSPYTPPPLVMNIDEIPFPTFEGIDIDAYDKRIIPMIFSRGCICRCAFCTDPIVWRKYRYRSAGHVLAEMEHHRATLGINNFIANDQIVNGHLPQLEELCDLILEKGLGDEITWGGNAVIRKDHPPELYKKMYAAGCRWLVYGIESGSDKVLSRMNKMFRSKTAEEGLKATKEAGLRVAINLIVGFPGEGPDEFQDTLDFLQRTSAYYDEVANLNPLIVTPRTSLERRPDRFDIILPEQDHWRDWTMEDGTNEWPERLSRVRRARDLLVDLGKPLVYVAEHNC